MADSQQHSVANQPVFHAPTFYPSPSITALREYYVGRAVQDVQAPAVVIDAAVARRNCKLMLKTTQQLGVGFRPHVKTHKTTELTELQVGDDTQDVKLVASTVSEIEHLVPYLQECNGAGKSINVIYGLPVSASSISRLGAVVRQLGEGSVSLFVDHKDQVALLNDVAEDTWPGQVSVFVKVDVGYHRAGVATGSGQLADLAYALNASQRTKVTGLYAHMGHSYAVSSPQEALKAFSEELQGLEEGAIEFLKCTGAVASRDPDAPKMVLSLGATPTTTSTQNILDDKESTKKYRELLERVNRSFEVELHAGVYAVLDMQQLATRARPAHAASESAGSMLSFADLGLRTLVEVTSVYDDRGKPEAMMAAGSIVLGREPCKSYDGWGVVSSWPQKTGQVYDPEGDRTGWMVGRISQEHGVLTWEGSVDQTRRLQVGEKLMIYPNHACMNGPNFGWYLIVDSDSDDPDKVVDVWVRWRGW
ncbi:hypothetical protein B0A48_03161 [Cryoendolithus antarcticus]|uniref:D-serine dehydratase n=1 Tax=Cryoendolithus antarcticus TaxID=1507870 RepID=A0A1V8TMA9_9PEZI|nr:hypothetical protein B0A48_03161 [Cryoendolithus antarcticus]